MGNGLTQRIVFCPHPPLLIPGLGGQSAPVELASLRKAISEAIQWLMTGADRLTVVGSGPRTAHFPSGTHARTTGFGTTIDLSIGTGPDEAVRPDVPTSLLVAAALVGGTQTRVDSWALGADDPRVVEAIRSSDRVLVMGDGSARRRDGAPGYVDERAIPFDDGVARMIGDAEVELIRGLDVELADQLLVAGIRPWQAVAEAIGPTSMSASLDHYSAPYGVAYYVARWSR